MSDAPKRIWAVHHETQGAVMIGEWADTVRHLGGIEYIRADLYTALQTRLAEVEAGRQSLFDLWSREKAARFDAETRSEAAEDSLKTARADALREAAKICEGSSARGEDIFFTILALIDNPEQTK